MFSLKELAELAEKFDRFAAIEKELKGKDKPVTVKPRVKGETGVTEESSARSDDEQTYQFPGYISQQETLNLLKVMDTLLQRAEETGSFDTSQKSESLTSAWTARHIAHMTVLMARDSHIRTNPERGDNNFYLTRSRATFAAIAAQPENELTGPYAYAIRDLALMTENRKRMDRLNIDRELSVAEQMKLAERFTRQGFLKHARAQATAHLNSFKAAKPKRTNA
jgi:hypothetical protein